MEKTTSIRPVVAITLGDASGVGPEVVAKALGDAAVYRACRPLVIGDARIMGQGLALSGKRPALRSLARAGDAAGNEGQVDILDLHNLDPREVTAGRICAPCGKAAVDYIFKACDLALDHQVDAIATAPINKEATRAAGYGELGHMEMLARRTNSPENATMLCSGQLRAVHLTTHHSLKEALKYVTRDNILRRLKLTHSSFQTWGLARPAIAVAALNPHGGEGGLLGDEEIREIQPAVQAARSEGIDARGPFPADSIFVRAIAGEFQVVLVLYHDQGHIPIKVFGFEKSVSVALGLPFIRTSVDHGTAFDIAGKGLADSRSMVESILVAARLAAGLGLG